MAPPYMVVKAQIDKSWRGSSILVRRCRPLIETPDLFRQFMGLKLDRDSILKFANQYGSIEEWASVDYQNRGYWIDAVSMAFWKREVQAMIIAHQLLDWANNNDEKSLKQYICWHPTRFDVQVAFRMDGRKMRISNGLGQLNPRLPGESSEEWMARCAKETRKAFDRELPGEPWGAWLVQPTHVQQLRKMGWNREDLTGPARLVVRNIVNTRLEKLCRPRLYLDKHRGLTGYWTPADLLGCIWLQFYLTVIGQLRLRRCTVCGKEMNVTDSRSTKKMHGACSKRTRMQRWRASKQP